MAFVLNFVSKIIAMVVVMMLTDMAAFDVISLLCQSFATCIIPANHTSNNHLACF